MTEELVVRSDVARDILGTASDYGTVPKMTVEYVSNSLDNPDDPTQPVTVRVGITTYGRKKTITIADNGSGMDHEALSGFFVMHRENVQRQRGRRARGRFGTGKAAGFGVGTAVHIDTVRNGRQWRVELTHTELVNASRENRAPLPRRYLDGHPTDLPNGTTVTITGVSKQAKPAAIANELRRRLGRQVESHWVYVAGERVHLHEPTAATTWTFTSAEDLAALEVLGEDLRCSVHAVPAGATVDEAIRGVIVTSRDVPVGQYFAAGDHASRIYGVCEVPALDADTSTPSPFTDRRDMALNVDNPAAAAVVGWVRRCLEQAARELQDEERDRRRRARDAELTRAAERAETILNEHYRTDFRLAYGSGTAGGSSAAAGTNAGELHTDPDGDSVVPTPRGTAGYQPPEPAPSDSAGPDPDDNEEGAAPSPEPDPGPDQPNGPGTPRAQERDPLSDGRGEAVTQLAQRRRRRGRGGFQIDYAHGGSDAPRAQFLESDLTIVINMDHPLLAAIRPDNDLFQGLAFTTAAEEYAQYTTNQLIQTGQIDIDDPYEALQRLRTTMDQLTRAFAQVFDTLAAPAAVAQ